MAETAPFRVLTVCVGNVCRSPLAERLLAARLDTAAPGRFAVASAGTRGLVGRPMDPDAADQLVRLGGDPGGFAARRLDPDLVARADLVLTATRYVRTAVVSAQPRALRRTFTLGELATLVPCAPAQPTPADLVAWATGQRSRGASGPDVPDPVGAPRAVHREVADLLDALTATVAEALAAATGPVT